jgi:S1-C subfamily serine protease
MAVLGAALTAGRLLAFNVPGSGGSGISLPGSGAVPAPGSSAAQLSGGEQAIVTKVKPGLAIINTTPRYDSEAAGTGMVINADRLVLTNNHAIDDSTKITGTVAQQARPTRQRWWTTTRPRTSPYSAAERTGMTTAPIGNSSSVKDGFAVVALGNAPGRGTITVTAARSPR